ncbi:MAG TPA: hypothetical protein VJY62_21220 [Bacteroidia bacterium]|nr:hypothetical protein [Bacteroidia bacterium]
MTIQSHFTLLYVFLFITGCSSHPQNRVLGEDVSKNNLRVSSLIQNPVLKGFDCDSFKYNLDDKYIVGADGYPYLTHEDSLKIITYAIKYGDIKYAFQNSKKDTNLNLLMYLLPRVRNIIDTVWYDRIQKDDNLIYNGLKKYDLYDLIYSDAVILGKVINKITIQDSSKCFFYKTEYLIKVNEVLHSNFKLNNGDYVVVKDKMGTVGGCFPEHPDYVSSLGHTKEYDIGDQCIYFLHHSYYYIKFLALISAKNHDNYDDKYCDKAFEMYNIYQIYDCNDKKIDNIRNFFNEQFKK